MAIKIRFATTVFLVVLVCSNLSQSAPIRQGRGGAGRAASDTSVVFTQLSQFVDCLVALSTCSVTKALALPCALDPTAVTCTFLSQTAITDLQTCISTPTYCSLTNLQLSSLTSAISALSSLIPAVPTAAAVQQATVLQATALPSATPSTASPSNSPTPSDTAAPSETPVPTFTPFETQFAEPSTPAASLVVVAKSSSVPSFALRSTVYIWVVFIFSALFILSL
mmetsp:Transcript_26936/g.43987  ORF Transcript_26936/g.43987 Transcript_26936/m.43987 type:complete len:224 (-) Transcript_26936:327-998(-)